MNPPSNVGKFLVLGCGGILLVAAILVVMMVSTYNTLIQGEEGIIASYNDGENVHSNTLKKIKQSGFAIEKYSEEVQKTIDLAIRGRYGSDGIQAGMAWIQEKNPEIDANLFKQLLVVIEAGNNQFSARQTDRLDRIRVYRTNLRSFPSSLLAGMLGFPRIDMDKYGKVVSMSESKQAMETGQDKAINPFDDSR